MSTTNNQQETTEQKVEQATVQSMKFIEKYKKQMLSGVIAVVVIALAFFAYDKFYKEPRHQDALAQMFAAEQYFRTDSFALALNGDGNSLGFEDIIKEYGKNAGAAVYMYAGISAMHLNEYEKAIGFLKKYNGEDPILKARALCNIGDCYAGLANLNEAAGYYMKAAAEADNIYAANYLLKAGIMYEESGNKAEALKQYQKIKDSYPQSEEGFQIDKYIERVKMSK